MLNIIETPSINNFRFFYFMSNRANLNSSIEQSTDFSEEQKKRAIN